MMENEISARKIQSRESHGNEDPRGSHSPTGAEGMPLNFTHPCAVPLQALTYCELKTKLAILFGPGPHFLGISAGLKICDRLFMPTRSVGSRVGGFGGAREGPPQR
jgi:hypothetical protein